MLPSLQSLAGGKINPYNPDVSLRISHKTFFSSDPKNAAKINRPKRLNRLSI